MTLTESTEPAGLLIFVIGSRIKNTKFILGYYAYIIMNIQHPAPDVTLPSDYTLLITVGQAPHTHHTETAQKAGETTCTLLFSKVIYCKNC